MRADEGGIVSRGLRPQTWKWLTLGWAGAILVATSIPLPQDVVEAPPGADKVVHLVMYLPLAWGWLRWQDGAGRVARAPIGLPDRAGRGATGSGCKAGDRDVAQAYVAGSPTQQPAPSRPASDAELQTVRCSRLGVWLLLAWVALFGLLDELHQYLIPGRSCSVFDLAADLQIGRASCRERV